MKRLGLRTLLFPGFVSISIIVGLELGIRIPSVTGPVSIYGIPFGLFFMIYPAMTKVRVDALLKTFKDDRSNGIP